MLGIKFDLINVGGGIPVPYKYDDENGDPLKDNMYAGITARDFADAVIREVHKWRTDVEICIEPGRKVTGSAAVLLTEVSCENVKQITILTAMWNATLNGNLSTLVTAYSLTASILTGSLCL